MVERLSEPSVQDVAGSLNILGYELFETSHWYGRFSDYETVCSDLKQ